MAQKRQSNGWEPPRKRLHSENCQAKYSNNTSYHESAPLPELPFIAPQYDPQVFTHLSGLTPAENRTDNKSYERLEFLGDAYVELFASRLIWQKFPSLPAGKMSQLRESLVKNETLAELTCLYGFDAKFRGASVLRHNPTKWVKVKGDIFEAYIAAVVLSDPEKGVEKAETWLVDLWTPRLKLAEEKAVPNMQSKVQLAAKIGGKEVRIDYVDEKAPMHEKGDQVFFLGAYLTGWGWDNQHLGSGKGTSKNAAGNDAAARALLNTTLIDEIVAMKKRTLSDREVNATREDSAG